MPKAGCRSFLLHTTILEPAVGAVHRQTSPSNFDRTHRQQHQAEQGSQYLSTSLQALVYAEVGLKPARRTHSANYGTVFKSERPQPSHSSPRRNKVMQKQTLVALCLPCYSCTASLGGRYIAKDTQHRRHARASSLCLKRQLHQDIAMATYLPTAPCECFFWDTKPQQHTGTYHAN